MLSKKLMDIIFKIAFICCFILLSNSVLEARFRVAAENKTEKAVIDLADNDSQKTDAEVLSDLDKLDEEEFDDFVEDGKEDLVEEIISFQDDKILPKNKIDTKLFSDLKTTMTADFTSNIKDIEKIVIEGIALDEKQKNDVPVFEKAFLKQKQDFLKELQLSQDLADENFISAQKKTVRMDSIILSFRVAEKYLLELEGEKKISATEALILKPKIIFEIFEEIGSQIDQNNNKVILDFLACKKIIDYLLQEKDKNSMQPFSVDKNDKMAEELRIKVQKTLVLESQVLGFVDKVKELESELAEAKKVFVKFEQESKKNKELLSRVSQADLEKNTLKDELLRKNSESVSLQEELTKKLKDSKASLSEVEKKLNEAFSEKLLLQEKIQKNSEDVLSGKKDLAVVEAKVIAADSRTKSLEDDLKRKDEFRIQAEAKKDQLEKTVGDLNKTVTVLTGQVNDKIKDVLILEKNLKEESVSNKQIKLDNQILEEKLKTAKADVCNFQEKNKNLEKNLNQKLEEVLGLQINLNKITKERDALLMKQASLLKEKDSLQKAKDILTKELKKELAILSKKESQIEKMEGKRELLDLKLADLQERIVRVEILSESKQNKNKKGSEKLKLQLNSLGSDLEKTNKELEKTINEKNEIVKNLKNLEDSQSEKNVLVIKLQEHHDQTKKELSTIDEKLKNQAAIIDSSNKEQSRIEKELENTKLKLAEKKDVLTFASASVSELNEKPVPAPKLEVLPLPVSSKPQETIKPAVSELSAVGSSFNFDKESRRRKALEIVHQQHLEDMVKKQSSGQHSINVDALKIADNNNSIILH